MTVPLDPFICDWSNLTFMRCWEFAQAVRSRHCGSDLKSAPSAKPVVNHGQRLVKTDLALATHRLGTPWGFHCGLRAPRPSEANRTWYSRRCRFGLLPDYVFECATERPMAEDVVGEALKTKSPEASQTPGHTGRAESFSLSPSFSLPSVPSARTLK